MFDHSANRENSRQLRFCQTVATDSEAELQTEEAGGHQGFQGDEGQVRHPHQAVQLPGPGQAFKVDDSQKLTFLFVIRSKN